MAIVRLATNEVQVDDVIYSFDNTDHADAFEACVATVDLAYCIKTTPPADQRRVEPISPTGAGDAGTANSPEDDDA